MRGRAVLTSVQRHGKSRKHSVCHETSVYASCIQGFVFFSCSYSLAPIGGLRQRAKSWAYRSLARLATSKMQNTLLATLFDLG